MKVSSLGKLLYMGFDNVLYFEIDVDYYLSFCVSEYIIWIFIWVFGIILKIINIGSFFRMIRYLLKLIKGIVNFRIL